MIAVTVGGISLFFSSHSSILVFINKQRGVMVIASEKKLIELKREFHSLFPYLRIEFYSGHHEAGEGSPKEKQLDSDLTVEQVSGKALNEDYNILPSITVSELEAYFDENLGISAQVFRRSGNLWMQTTATDHWTLEEQNRKGGASLHHYNEKYKT
mgnify:CR=1 FL=1